MVLAAVCSETMALLLLIHCLIILPLFVKVLFGPCFVMYYLVSFVVFQSSGEEERELVTLL